MNARLKDGCRGDAAISASIAACRKKKFSSVASAPQGFKALFACEVATNGQSVHKVTASNTLCAEGDVRGDFPLEALIMGIQDNPRQIQRTKAAVVRKDLSETLLRRG
jgi:hypothetical protein